MYIIFNNESCCKYYSQISPSINAFDYLNIIRLNGRSLNVNFSFYVKITISEKRNEPTTLEQYNLLENNVFQVCKKKCSRGDG